MGLLILLVHLLGLRGFSCISMTMRASGRSAPVYGVAQEPTVAPLPTRRGRAAREGKRSVTICLADFDAYILSFDKTGLLQSLKKGGH
jgi:hypothetical protein